MRTASPATTSTWQEKYKDMVVPRRRRPSPASGPASGSSSARAAPSRCSWCALWSPGTASWPTPRSSTAHLGRGSLRVQGPRRLLLGQHLLRGRQRARASSRRAYGDYTPIYPLRCPTALQERRRCPSTWPLSRSRRPTSRDVQPRHIRRHREERGRERRPGHRPSKPADAAHSWRQLRQRVRPRRAGAGGRAPRSR